MPSGGSLAVADAGPSFLGRQVRVFPGKTFAFVNYYSTATAAMAQEALDNAHVPAIAGAPGSQPWL